MLATAQLANASSSLLPVSNLTNLLVFSATGLTFSGFAVRMTLPTAAVAAAVRHAGVEPSRGAFIRLGLLTTPVALVGATLALWVTLRAVG